jgi:hypothetical protein
MSNDTKGPGKYASIWEKTRAQEIDRLEQIRRDKDAVTKHHKTECTCSGCEARDCYDAILLAVMNVPKEQG